MRRVAFAALAAMVTANAPISARELEQEAELIFDDVPIHWVEPAYRALSDFKTRRSQTLSCFTASLSTEKEGGVRIEFSPRTIIRASGDDAILVGVDNSCGPGETYVYDSAGVLIAHWAGH